MRRICNLLLITLIIFMVCGCTSSIKLMNKTEFQEFSNNELAQYNSIFLKQSEAIQSINSSIRKQDSFNPYLDSDKAFEYLTLTKENEIKIKNLIDARAIINPPEEYKEINQKFMESLNISLSGLQKQEKLILDQDYMTLDRDDLTKLLEQTTDMGIYINYARSYVDRLKTDYINDLKDQQKTK
ncbi:MAG: hypothetical protein PHS04_10310 [Tissierellia bacterium]|nr:hypothetical protein [Tissierellia bacterium]